MQMDMLGEEAALRVLWGKSAGDGGYHPLVCHVIDVAMVASRIWNSVLSPPARQRVAMALGLPETDAGQWIAFWAGLHDLGKASPAFAVRKSEALGRAVRAQLPCSSVIPDVPHGVVTTRVLVGILADLGVLRAVASRVATAVGGHHGLFPRSDAVQDVPDASRGLGPWEDARLALVRAVRAAVEVSLGNPPRQIEAATAMFLAGLVSVADWIGSSSDHFPPAVRGPGPLPEIEPHAYAREADGRAMKALARLGWLGWQPSAATRDFGELFPSLPGPRPVQEAVVSLGGHLDRPRLVVIEAPMGEGKTEAAMYLADVWGAALGQRGCYFALPTQATSDQMFGRVRDFLAARYPEDVVNLQLLHGHAALSAEFEELRRNGDRLFEPTEIHGEESGDARNVVAAEWFTYRKRGLLAPFGVGTVDQALLAVLQTKHTFVRLFGLADRTVIIDEVHAYDTYMSTLLERLLEWLAALGSCVILLSATLPEARRRALVDAFARGLGGDPPTGATLGQPYPRVTWVHGLAAGARHVATSRAIARTVSFHWVDGRLPGSPGEPCALGECLTVKLANGGCAAIICNTVDRAQTVYQALKRYFPDRADDGWPELDLLHARYLFEDRDRREKRALVRFGKPGGRVKGGDGATEQVRRPWRAVLVSTQIIEQSLDLDFDLMVTEVAPVDLVLQRSGRLWRHARPRPPGLAGPELWLCQPVAAGDGGPDFGRGTERVYDRHILLRSWLELRERKEIRVPEEMEELIEAVYADRPCPDDLDESLRRRWEQTWQQHREETISDERKAEDRWVKHPGYKGALWRLTGDPREEDAPEFHQAHQALTRLADPAVQVVCLSGTAERPCFDQEGLDPVDLQVVSPMPLARRLLLRSASISDRRVVFSLLGQAVPRGWQRSALLCRHRLVTLGPAGSEPIGGYRLQLDESLGLMVVGPE